MLWLFLFLFHTDLFILPFLDAYIEKYINLEKSVLMNGLCDVFIFRMIISALNIQDIKSLVCFSKST